jgi:hypothetical protein
MDPSVSLCCIWRLDLPHVPYSRYITAASPQFDQRFCGETDHVESVTQKGNYAGGQLNSTSVHLRPLPPNLRDIQQMSDTENPASPATEEKRPVSTAEADLTKYKVSVNRNMNTKKRFITD